MKATALLLGVAVGACTSVASADIVLTFDDLGLPDGTAVTDQYARFGVMFSASRGGTTRIVTASQPIFPAEPQGLYNDECIFGVAFTEPIIANFPVAVTSAGAFIDFGNIGTGIKIEAFDGPGGTGNLLGTDSTINEVFIGVDAPGIRSVVFSQAGGNLATYLIDNFTLALAPSCPWDLDGDDIVGTGDLIVLLGSWGDPYGTADLIELLGNWGPCP